MQHIRLGTQAVCSSIQCILRQFQLQYSWEMYMKAFCSFSTNFSAAFAGRATDIWKDILIQITVNCFFKKNKNHAYAVENVMRAHKSYCVELLKLGAVFKDALNAQSFQHQGAVCCLPVPKGHTNSTGFEMCQTN